MHGRPPGEVREHRHPEVAARAGVRPGAERAARRPVAGCRRASGRGRSRAVRPASPGTRSGRRPRSSGLTSTTAPAGTRCPPRSTSRGRDAGGDPGRRRQAQRLPDRVDGVDVPGRVAASQASSQAPAAIGTWMPAASIVAVSAGCAGEPGQGGQGVLQRQRARRAPGGGRGSTAGGAAGGDDRGERVDPGEHQVGDGSRCASSTEVSTAAVVDRATGRRSSTMASYGSPGVPRSCAASAAAHSRGEDGRRAPPASGVSGCERRRGPTGCPPAGGQVAAAADVAGEVERPGR